MAAEHNVNVQERSSRTAAADGRLLRKVIGSNEGTGAQRIDRSRAPSARTLAVDSRWPPPWGLPSKGTAAEDAQSCTRARTIRLLKIAVWKIQRDGGATSALARAKDTPPVCRHRSHTGGTGWVTAKHESVPDRAPTRRSDGQTCGSDLLIYCIARIGRARCRGSGTLMSRNGPVERRRPMDGCCVR